MFLNAYHEPVTFVLPETADQDRWILLIDTRLPLPSKRTEFSTGNTYVVTERSTVVFGLEAEGATRQVLMDLEAAIYHAAKAARTAGRVSRATALQKDGPEAGLPGASGFCR
jgi:glycogen operon protein